MNGLPERSRQDALEIARGHRRTQVEPLPVLVNVQGSKTGEGQEPKELEVEEEEQEPIGLEIEEEARTSQAHDTDIAPEE